MIDFLKKTFHIPEFARGGIIEKPIVYEECDPPEFVVNQERLTEFIEAVRLNEERKTMKQMILKKPLLDDLKGIKEVLASQGDPILASVLNRAIACVEKQPIVDALPVKHGRWIYEHVEFTYEKDIKCSICGGYTEKATYFCPNCGSCMDGERKHNEY